MSYLSQVLLTKTTPIAGMPYKSYILVRTALIRRRRPNLITDLLALITTNLDKRLSNPTIPDPQASLVLHRSLRALNAILKKFSNIKFLTGIAVMRQVRRPFLCVLTTTYIFLSCQSSSILCCRATTSSTLQHCRPHLMSPVSIVRATPRLSSARICYLSVWRELAFGCGLDYTRPKTPSMNSKTG